MPDRSAKSPNRKNAHGIRSVGFLVCGVVVVFATGCGSPNVASIEVRKQNQDLRDQIELLNRTHEADRATIRGMQNRAGTLPTLPQDRLDKLFTVHGLDRTKPGDEGLKIYAAPTDETGEPIKAAGSFVVEAFDLAAKPPEIGKWTYDVDAVRKTWLGSLMLNHFVLTAPWQTVPKHDEITVKVTFRDALTGREFTAQKLVKVRLPATQPSTAAAAAAR
jgi:hypothetical protein